VLFIADRIKVDWRFSKAPCQGDSHCASRYSHASFEREVKMSWWSWMILGAILLGAEMFAIDAQFFLVFIGVSAFLVGVAGWIGIAMPEWVQWMVFAVLALIFMFTFRKSLYARIRGGAKGFQNTLLGDSLTVKTDIAPGTDARVAHRGSDWTALNVGEAEIASGSRAKIIKVDGLTLHISAD
jgi:membrane protein implicated in regulation of membrane protease activity